MERFFYYFLAPLDLDDYTATKIAEDSWNNGNHALDLESMTGLEVQLRKEEWIRGIAKNEQRKYKRFVEYLQQYPRCMSSDSEL